MPRGMSNSEEIVAKEKSFVPPNEMPPRPIQPLLVGQKALVTGASKGIGRGIAVALAQAGADVLINYFSDREGAETTAEEVRQIGRQALVAAADVAVEQEVQAMFERMIDTFGRIDILINNSGIQLNAPFDQMSLAQWQRVIDINLTGQFLCAREAVRAFKQQGIKLIGKPIIRGGQASRRMSQPSRRSRKLSRSSSAA